MNAISPKNFIIGLCMLAAAGLAVAMKPAPVPPQLRPNLEALIPKHFDDWVIDPDVVPVLPSPDQKQMLDETYDQIVNRTYVNSKGERIMISIAYGSQQTQKLKAHRQEVCYASQGYEIRDLVHEKARVAGSDITVTRMYAISKARHEPVTYWFTVGDQVVQSRLDRLLVQLQYAFTGMIPDGVLVRVSNISTEPQQAYQKQLDFINAMLAQMPPESARKFVGLTHS
jgi:EpsI family protein